jgi:hypothetical protein
VIFDGQVKNFVIYQWNIRFVFKFIFVNLIFNLIFPNKKTSVAMNPHQYQPYYLIHFFNEVMRLVVRENHWLLRLFCKKN